MESRAAKCGSRGTALTESAPALSPTNERGHGETEDRNQNAKSRIAWAIATRARARHALHECRSDSLADRTNAFGVTFEMRNQLALVIYDLCGLVGSPE